MIDVSKLYRAVLNCDKRYLKYTFDSGPAQSFRFRSFFSAAQSLFQCSCPSLDIDSLTPLAEGGPVSAKRR